VEVQQRISRRQDNDKTEANLAWLVQHSAAHLHTDLIFGLPGETLESFAAGFDRLYALHPQEIQLGLLKRLRGTPIARHSLVHGMVYDAHPPYALIQSAVVDAPTVERFIRLARYWDLIANSGRFACTLAALLSGPSAFGAFWACSDWLWQTVGTTAGLTPEALADALFDYLTSRRGFPLDVARQLLLVDYAGSGAHGRPQCLRDVLPRPQQPDLSRHGRQLAARQFRHQPDAAEPESGQVSG
jgi:hypothetical protein